MSKPSITREPLDLGSFDLRIEEVSMSFARASQAVTSDTKKLGVLILSSKHCRLTGSGPRVKFQPMLHACSAFLKNVAVCPACWLLG
jgi:hypothetical protein